MDNNQRGLAPLFILVILGLLIILVSGASYYLLRAGGKEVLPLGKSSQETNSQPVSGSEVSNSSDLDTISQELDNTSVGSLDQDFSTIDSTASGL